MYSPCGKNGGSLHSYNAALLFFHYLTRHHAVTNGGIIMIAYLRALLAHMLLLAMFCTAGTVLETSAQEIEPPPLPYATVQDTVHLLRIFGNDTVPAGMFSASYEYEMVYDSISHTNYMFTECKRNRSAVSLLHWEYERVVHAPAEYLTYNSRTADFPVRAGDTISFYRELRWYDPLQHRQDTNNYYALDTLDFSVHLVRTSDGAPLALLDSIGVMPRLLPGAPDIYGSRPIMALVEYVVPSAGPGDSAFVGVTVRARGSGAHDFTRQDLVTIGVSERLRKAYYQDYLDIYGRVYGKRNVEELASGNGAQGARLSVRGEGRSIRIGFTPAPGGAWTAVALYDASGNLVFYPYSGRSAEPELNLEHRLSASGAYFVVLQHGGRVVKTEKITVTY